MNTNNSKVDEAKLSDNEFDVVNFEGEPSTKARVLIANSIDYTPKVSVIMPVYNVSKYLPETFDSLLNQTLKQIEIICVDDGSTDSSLDILRRYAAKDKRISVVTQHNHCAGVARNAGLMLAKGDYLSFLDSDDIFDPVMLEEAVAKADADQSDVVIYGYQILNEARGEITGRCHLQNQKPGITCVTPAEVARHIFTIIPSAPWTKLFRREHVMRQGIRFVNSPSTNDLTFVDSMIALASRISLIDKLFVTYRFNQKTNISANRGAKINYFISAIAKLKGILTERGVFEQFREAYDFHCARAAIWELKQCSELKQREQHVETLATLISPQRLNEIKGTVLGIPVAVAADDNYSETLAVCLYSILSKTKAFLNIVVLDGGITDGNKTKIAACIAGFTNFTIRYVNMEKFGLDRFPSLERFGLSTFSRYFVPEIFPGIDKVVYTDADVIFTRDIKKYFDIDMKGYGVAATPEECGSLRGGRYNHEYRKNTFGIPQTHSYFAAGNMIISCNYWRQHIITRKLIAKTDELRENLVCPDLDVLNAVFANNYLKLPYKYCTCVHRIHSTEGDRDMESAFRDPFIIHYSGASKPWDTCNVAFYREYADILRKIAFRMMRVKDGKVEICEPMQQEYAKLRKDMQRLLCSMCIDCTLDGEKDASHLDVSRVGCISVDDLPTLDKQRRRKRTMRRITVASRAGGVTIKARAEGTLNLAFSGLEVKTEPTPTPVWIDYTKIRVNGNALIKKLTKASHGNPVRYELTVKAGDEIRIELSQVPHNYKRWQIKDLLLKLNAQNGTALHLLDKLAVDIHRRFKLRRLVNGVAVRKLFHRRKIADK